MTTSFKARPMTPGKDTISVMALHYGVTPSTIRNIIESAGAEVIREDGFRGTLVMVKSISSKRKVLGWSDGVAGLVEPDKIRLTKSAISAVVQWTIEQDEDDENQ